jgi:zinc/manganese transport system ATP-binding protein
VTAIACDHLSVSIGGKTILSDVSLAIERGEFVGVLGANGSGKTTLMRAILGVIGASGGAIRVFDEPVRRGNPAVGYAPQVRSPVAHSRIRGWDFVASVANGHRWGLPWRTAMERKDIDQAIRLVGAQDLARRPISDLSGGERQRLLIAQALVGGPKLLLLDEPLISLDPAAQAAMIALISQLQKAHDLTVLFAAHDINPLLGVMDRVLYLSGGNAALGSVNDVITSASLSRLYNSDIEVIRAGGRIFVLSDQTDHHHACDHA